MLADLSTHSNVWQDLFICVIWPIHMCDRTHSYVWFDSFICVTGLIQMCDRTHSDVWYDPFICVTGLIQMCDMTHSYVWQDSFICVIRPIHLCERREIMLFIGKPMGRSIMISNCVKGLLPTKVGRPLQVMYMSESGHMYEGIISSCKGNVQQKLASNFASRWISW